MAQRLIADRNNKSRSNSVHELLELSFFNEPKSSRLFCSKFFEDPNCPGACQGCGFMEDEHVNIPPGLLGTWNDKAVKWRADLHRVHLPRTDGTPTHKIEFVDENEGIQKQAQLAILAVDSHPNLFMETILDDWGLKIPDIVISIAGSLNHLNLKREEFNGFQSGLVKVVSTTKCWVITGGTNDGVDELTSRALKEVQYLKWLGKTQVNFDLIAINNWNCVAENRSMSIFWSGDSLPQHLAQEVPSPVKKAPNLPRQSIRFPEDLFAVRQKRWSIYASNQSLARGERIFKYNVKRKRSKKTIPSKPDAAGKVEVTVRERYETHLNPIYTHFLAIETAVREKHGELPARLAFESFCAKTEATIFDQRLTQNPRILSTPTVLLVFGGDDKTLEHVAKSVESGIPVVLCQGSGGISDYLARLLSKVPTNSAINKLPYYQTLVRQVLSFMVKDKAENELFSGNQMNAAALEPLIFKCIKHRNGIKIYKLGNPVASNLQTCIFSALLEGQTAKSDDPVKLALRWNYCGNLVEEILIQEEDINMRPGIQDLMLAALENEEKIQFTRLFLELGFTMEKFLTPEKLALLYERSYESSSIMESVFERCSGKEPSGQMRLQDIYDLCYYCTTSQPVRALKQNGTFVDPYRELFLWALLNGRLRASEFFWMQASNQLILALIGSELCKVVGKSFTGDLCKLTEPYNEASQQYIDRAYDILQSAWDLNPGKAIALLETRLPLYGDVNVMDVAWFIETKVVISHPCFQQLVQTQWGNGLNCYHGKVILSLVNPLSVLFLTEAKSTSKNNSEGQKTLAIPWEDMHTVPEAGPIDLQHQESDALIDQVDDFLAEHKMAQARTTNTMSVDISYSLGDPISKSMVRDYWRVWKRKANLFYFSPACKFIVRLLFHIMFVLLLSKFYLFDFHYYKHNALEYFILINFVSILVEIGTGFWLKMKFTLFSLRWRIWRRTEWNFLDVTVCIIGIVAFACVPIQAPLTPGERREEQILPNLRKGCYAFACLFSWIKILRYYQFEKKLGTVWIMLRKMMAETMIFMSIMMTFLCSFGLCLTILFGMYGYEDPYTVSLFRSIMRAFFIINGEYFLETFDEAINNKVETGDFTYEQLIALVRMKTYYIIVVIVMLFVGNAMMLNILIAVFGQIYAEIMEKSDEEWKTERFTMVREFQSRSSLPHPLNLATSLYRMVVSTRNGVMKLHKWMKCSRQTPSSVHNASNNERNDLDKFESIAVQTMLRNKSDIKTKDELIEGSLKSKDKIFERINFLHSDLEKLRKTKNTEGAI